MPVKPILIALSLLVTLPSVLRASDGAVAQEPHRAANEPTLPAIAVHVPSGWKQAGQSTFERLNPETVAADTATVLSGGHQPWRLDARNIAAECLLNFRVTEGKDVFQVADRLSPGSRPGEFVLSLPGNRVIVTVQTYNHVPVAQCVRLVDQCEDPRTTVDMRACAWKKYREADDELNKVYKTLMDRLDDQKHREMLIKAQRDWIRFRDSSADFEDYFFEGGSIKEQVKAYALERLTRARSKELREVITSQFDR